MKFALLPLLVASCATTSQKYQAQACRMMLSMPICTRGDIFDSKEECEKKLVEVGQQLKKLHATATCVPVK